MAMVAEQMREHLFTSNSIGHRPHHRQQPAQTLGAHALRDVQSLFVPVLQKPLDGPPIK